MSTANSATNEIQKILVIDDNQDLMLIVSQALRQHGYEVWQAFTGKEALQLLDRWGLPHLAVVDITMPVMDGIEFCQRIQHLGLPIIMLTALAQEKIITQTLEQFADDYITKPFSTRELIARIERVLRRTPNYNYTALEVEVDEHLQINFAQQQMKIKGQLVDLTPTESEIMLLLSRHLNHVVHFQLLSNYLWPSEEPSRDRLRVHISRLKHKIHQIDQELDYIISERGRGYRLQANSK